MRKIIKIVFSIIFVCVSLYIFFVILVNQVGDVRPSILPPKNNLTEIIGKKQQGVFTLPETQNISVFAKDLGGPRDMVFSPQGVLFVSIPSRDQVVAIFDNNDDGVADSSKVLISDLDNPHGLEFENNILYVASEIKVVSYKWDTQAHEVYRYKNIANLPKGGRHNTRTLAIDPSKDPGKPSDIYISIGSTCDVCFEPNPWLAGVIKTNTNGDNPQVYAKGLRNAVFIKINDGLLWGTEMGRDFLGDNLPPDEINIIKQGGDYGWPICFGNKIYDTKFNKLDPKFCDNTIPPVYEIQAHSAPLGLTFINSDIFPESWQGDMLVAYHGSWNRSVPDGYKVVRLDREGDKILGESDYLTGFLQGSRTIGRPVDLEFSPKGDLFISDDKAGVIYRITKN
jgi:glucose/arabinose dehydrogenase